MIRHLGLHYNPYFPNGAIGMAQALNEGVVEYDDKSVEPSVSQMAKVTNESFRPGRFLFCFVVL